MKHNSSLVSIIVPVYNAEKYLRECIDSIVTQTYSNTEIILIDDGSTDQSGIICSEYAKQDKRVRLVRQKNTGVSSARNAGIELARGEYITFIDADDTVHKDFVKILQEELQKYNATTITTVAMDVKNNDMQTLRDGIVREADVLVLSVDNTVRELYRGTLEGTRNGKQMFSLKMLNDSAIRYNCKMAIGEDFDFFARAILVSNKVIVDKKKLYFYRSNPSSAMLQDFNRSHFEAIKNVENIGRSIEGKIPGLKKSIDTMVFSDAIYYGAKMMPLKHMWPEEYYEISNLVRKYRFMVLCNGGAKKNTRIKALVTVLFGVNIGLIILKRLIRW